jgi:hypothetical protein
MTDQRDDKTRGLEMMTLLKMTNSDERSAALDALDPDEFRRLAGPGLHYHNYTNNLFDRFYILPEHRSDRFRLFLASGYERLTYALEHGFQASEISNQIWSECLYHIPGSNVDNRVFDREVIKLFLLYHQELDIPLADSKEWNSTLSSLANYPEAFSFFYDLVISQDPTFKFSLELEIDISNSVCQCDNLAHLLRAGVTAQELLKLRTLEYAMDVNSTLVDWWIREDLGLPEKAEIIHQEWFESMNELIPEAYHKMSLYILSKGRLDLFNIRRVIESMSLLQEAVRLDYITQEELEELLPKYHVNSYKYRNIKTVLERRFLQTKACR